jgi:hypothetical protein
VKSVIEVVTARGDRYEVGVENEVRGQPVSSIMATGVGAANVLFADGMVVELFDVVEQRFLPRRPKVDEAAARPTPGPLA